MFGCKFLDLSKEEQKKIKEVFKKKFRYGENSGKLEKK